LGSQQILYYMGINVAKLPENPVVKEQSGMPEGKNISRRNERGDRK
jgi:hypothetical protein